MQAGLDEAGCGPAFGDLVASACVLTEPIEGLADSKRLTPAKRRKLFDRIVSTCPYGIGVVTNEEIDRWGLAWARRAVFHRALDDLEHRSGIVPSSLVVDGTLFAPWRDVPYECVPKADVTVPCVSAASILAKQTRDDGIVAIVDKDPTLEERYGILSNKGYLSKKHIEGIQTHGLTTLHRKSYNIKAVRDPNL